MCVRVWVSGSGKVTELEVENAPSWLSSRMKDELFSTSTSIFASSSCLVFHGKQQNRRAEPEAESVFFVETLAISIFRSAGKPSSLLELLVTSIILS